jgi:hypothetical protein
MKKISVLSLACALLLTGCAKKRPATSSFYASSEYQNRALLQQSLFRSDQAILSNEEIETILSSRIQLPKNAHLTILRLGEADELLSWAFLANADSPFVSLAGNPRLTRVSWLPSLLIPEKLTVPLLREAAARFQADLLLVYRTPCQRFQNYRLFGDDTARTYCVAEALLLDVRTGVIPFSTASAKQVNVRETKDDVSFYETLKKAESTATAEAIAELTQQVSQFLASAP